MARTEKETKSRFDNGKVTEIEMERLRTFKNHSFKVTDDKEMYLLKESIEKYGVLNPLIVRPVLDGFVVDWMVQDQINQAFRQVAEAIRRVEEILRQL
jgi:hypothetical protein